MSALDTFHGDPDEVPDDYVEALDAPAVPPADDRPWVRVSVMSVYLEWLDEVRTILARHADEAVERWASPVAPEDLAEELRVIADGIRELAEDLDSIADAIEHAKHWCEQGFGGRR